jgi:DNA-binding GntR family transcriptional regulator
MLNFRTNFWTDEDDDSTSPQIGSADAVARQIVRRLYSGRYVAGQRLIEADLTREFKVSRGSLREALRRLAAEGVVSITKHYGACIRSFTKSEVLDVVRVFETLLVLAVQQGAARAAAGASTDEISRQLDLLGKVTPDSDYFDLVQRQNGMYRALVEMSGNREIARTIPALNMHFIRNPYRAFSPRLAAARLNELRAIRDAICAGNTYAAAAAARDHVENAAAELERLPADAFAEHSDASRT